MKSIKFILLAGGLLGAVPALAQDIDPTFTGPRLEGFGGVDIQKYKFSPVPAGADTKHTGGVAGALAGFDFAFGGVVVGAFGTVALPTSTGCAPQAAGQPGRCVRPERELEGGGRVGFQIRDRVLIYGKGAYVNTSFKVQSSFTGGRGIFNTHRNIDGYRVGGGAEYAVTENAYVKLEYNYTRTNRFDLTPYGFANTSYRQTKSQVLGGFGIRF